MARSKRQSGNGKTQPERQRGIHAQLAGPEVLESIDRNIAHMERLVGKAEKADREKLDRIKVQMQGINYVIAAQMKKLNKIVPDAKQTETAAAGPTNVRDVPFEDRLMAAHYGMRPHEYVQRREAGTLPPMPPIPEPEDYNAQGGENGY